MLLVAGPEQARLPGGSQFTQRSQCEHAEPALLVGTQRLIERLPRRGELLEVGRSLSEGIGAPIHEFNRIAVAQPFDRALVSPSSQACRYALQPALPVIGPGADSLLDRPPEFFLIRRQLQR